jgi:nucleoside-diphosphate-sugar epimerase
MTETGPGDINNKRVLVTGGGGFIGGHLVRRLLELGAAHVRSVDVRPEDLWYQRHNEVENVVADLSGKQACLDAVRGSDVVFNLAADMGGMGFIESNKALCMLSVLINTHLLMATRMGDVERYFYSSSACVYAAEHQSSSVVRPLAEADAYPAMPEDGYGWEKLFSERMCRHFREDFGLETRVARYHNVYGPHGTYAGGREKAPAAICRKVAQAKLSGDNRIEVWGDGEQTRSFTFIDDCIHGTLRIAMGSRVEPINLGSSELVTITQLVNLVEEIAGVELERHYLLDAPQGVRGRNSDNSQILEEYGWEPSTSLRVGLEKTFTWIYDQLASGQRAAIGAA